MSRVAEALVALFDFLKQQRNLHLVAGIILILVAGGAFISQPTNENISYLIFIVGIVLIIFSLISSGQKSSLSEKSTSTISQTQNTKEEAEKKSVFESLKTMHKAKSSIIQVHDIYSTLAQDRHISVDELEELLNDLHQ